jgi:hypothetical protein
LAVKSPTFDVIEFGRASRNIRHCERSEAIQLGRTKKEWIASSLRSSQ